MVNNEVVWRMLVDRLSPQSGRVGPGRARCNAPRCHRTDKVTTPEL
ncbi:hypothetical protein ALC60_06786 [Trachymyrmex zeteki]|uniref:Uncharacterized protein n=1 Tax=Mycetomoellerius zeteki TaxID=64791 RepID=A0A151X1G4_9HYME|nr:hypothetical protein ALC60_06786 [Trachymyrmex zeteki]